MSEANHPRVRVQKSSEMFRAAVEAGVKNACESSEIFSDVQESSEVPCDSQICKTKPNSARKPRGLSARQLAAARLLIKGIASAHVAEIIRVTPQTISRWKLNVEFQDEMGRLHDLIAVRPVTSQSPRARASTGRLPSRRKLFAGLQIDPRVEQMPDSERDARVAEIIERCRRNSGLPASG